jgi:hypothetical protein
LNEGILEGNIKGVVGGHKTIFERPDEENPSSDENLADDVMVIDDYGANRGATIIADDQ